MFQKVSRRQSQSIGNTLIRFDGMQFVQRCKISDRRQKVGPESFFILHQCWRASEEGTVDGYRNNKTDAPAGVTYSSVVSRGLVRIPLLIASLNRLKSQVRICLQTAKPTIDRSLTILQNWGLMAFNISNSWLGSSCNGPIHSVGLTHHWKFQFCSIISHQSGFWWLFKRQLCSKYIVSEWELFTI
jgi:hypothetical protein